MITNTCKDCGDTKVKIKSDIPRPAMARGFYYLDEKGKRWNGRSCPDCMRAKFNRWKPKRPLDQCTFPPIAKGRRSEHLVANHFRKQRFQVAMTTSRGPDLILTRNAEKLSCEVKTVTIKRDGDRRYFTVGKVYVARKSDDLIAYVYPDDQIEIHPMQEHLQRTPKSGCTYLGRAP